MGLTHLVDTSVLTRIAQREVSTRIYKMAVAGELARATISDLEIGYQARNPHEHRELLAALDVFETIDVGPEHVRRALEVQRQVAGESNLGQRVPELLVAAVAEFADLTVLHYDDDFDEIAALTGQTTEWIAAPGSLD